MRRSPRWLALLAGGAILFCALPPAGAQRVIDLGAGEADVSIHGAGILSPYHRADHLGIETAVGDLNGDGTPDLVAAAWGWGGPDDERALAPAVLILFGAADLAGTVELRDRDPDVVIHPPNDGVHFGEAMAIGDLDGDGVDDLALGLVSHGSRYDESTRPLDLAGRIEIFRGGSSWPAVWDLKTQPATWRVRAALKKDFLGSVFEIGDVTGDGVADLVAGVAELKFPGLGPWKAGHVLIFEGGPGWPGDWYLASREPAHRIIGPRAWDRMGLALALPDLDGDGVQDIAIGAPHSNGPEGPFRRGAMYLVLAGNGLPPVLELAETPPDMTVRGRDYRDFTGEWLAAGDFDGDGTDDLAVASPGMEQGWQNAHAVRTGVVDVFLGGDSLPSFVEPPGSQSDVRFIGEKGTNSELGVYLAAGDLNGDGLDDLLFRAAGRTTYVEYGAPGWSGRKWYPEDAPDLTITHEKTWYEVQTRLGDLTGDGITDLLIGNPYVDIAPDGFHEPADAGAVYVYAGGALQDPLVAGEAPAHLTLQGRRGLTLRRGPFLAGYSVGAGDFDGDGLDDLLLSEPMRNAPTLLTLDAFRGCVDVFRGSGGRLVGVADLEERDPDIRIYGPRGHGRFGSDLVLGDVNGDGVEDLVTVAQLSEGYDFGSGPVHNTPAAFVVYGRTNPSSVVDLATEPPDVTITFVYDDSPYDMHLDTGDLNGDGFADIVIRHPRSSPVEAIGYNTTVWILFGATTLPGAIELGTSAPGLTAVVAASDINRENPFGHYLAVGDYDGDGLDDLAIADRNLPDPDGDRSQGGAYLLLGRAAWPERIHLAETPAELTVMGPSTLRDQRLGWGVALTDLTGDGKDDLVITQSQKNYDTGYQRYIYRVFFGSTLAPPVLWDMPERTPDATIVPASDFPSFELGRVLSADWTGDGPEEILFPIRDSAGSMVLLEPGQDLSGKFEVGWSTPLVVLRPESPDDILGHTPRKGWPALHGTAAGDLDADGRPDLIAGALGRRRNPDEARTWGSGAAYVLYNDCSPCDTPFAATERPEPPRAGLVYRDEAPVDVTDPANLQAEWEPAPYRDPVAGDGELYFYVIEGPAEEAPELLLRREAGEVVLSW